MPLRSPYPSSGDVNVLYMTKAAPVTLAINNSRASVPNIIVVNSGELRYGIFEGPFTKNDQLTVVPFPDSFSYIPNVKASVANQVLPAFNSASASKRSQVEMQLWGRGRVESRFHAWLEEMDKRKMERTNATDLTLGYVTKDVSLFSLAVRSVRC